MMNTQMEVNKTMNTISITGRLTRDAELRYTPSGKPVSSFCVASDYGYGDRKKANFFECGLWGERAEKVTQYLTKGTPLTVIGELEIYEYQGKDGIKRKAIRVHVDKFEFQGSKPTGTDSVPKPDVPPVNDFEDSIPF